MPLPSTISSSRTLRLADSPHRVSGTVTVQAGATLTIEPGVTLLFGDNGNLVVDGSLVAAGTARDRIAMRRDSCAGNGEGMVLRDASGRTQLSHCDIENLPGAAGATAGIVLDGANAALDHVTCSGPQGRAAIEVRGGGSLLLTDSWLEGAGTGLRVAAGGGLVTRCVFRDLQGAAVQVTNGNAIAVDHLTIFDCTIGFDLRESTPGGDSGTVDAHSIIVWLTALPLAGDAGSAAAITHSDLSGGAPPGAGNISSDPRFVDAPQGDFRLRFASPCRAAGKDGTDMGAVPYTPTGETTRFLRCDPNGDGSNDIADAVTTLLHLFGGAGTPSCAAALDCDGDGQTTITDVIFDLSYLFTEGPSPPAPFPTCEETPIEQCGAALCLQ
jgi:hypothetical protein